MLRDPYPDGRRPHQAVLSGLCGAAQAQAQAQAQAEVGGRGRSSQPDEVRVLSKFVTEVDISGAHIGKAPPVAQQLLETDSELRARIHAKVLAELGFDGLDKLTGA